jgi:hypothetical protein
MEVRLTVQMWDRNRKVRVTEHADISLSRAKEKASEIAGRMIHYHRTAKTPQQPKMNFPPS